MLASLLLLVPAFQETEYPVRSAFTRPLAGGSYLDRVDRPRGLACPPFEPRRHLREGDPQVRAALGWLAKAQRPDGSWDPGQEDFRSGVTALALLALIGGGHTHLCADLGPVIRRGLDWLLRRQDPDGALCAGASATERAQHALAALAITEATGTSGSFVLREPAERAILYLLSQWKGDPEPSVWGWGVLAIESARSWDFAVRAGEAAAANVSFAPGPVALVVHYFLGRSPRNPLWTDSLDLLRTKLPRWGNSAMDFHTWYWGTLALFRADEPLWKEWTEPIVAHQDPDGSWDPADRRGAEGGRAYATAMNALTLEIPRRWTRVFRSH